MFEKRDYRLYQAVKRDNVYPNICDFWAHQGFYVAQLSPYQIRGESFHQNIGLRRVFYLTLYEQENNTYIDLQFQARISDEGAIGGVAAAVIFWPVAVVGGALSYSEYEKDANALMYNFWVFLDELTNQRGVLPPGWRPPQQSFFSDSPPPPPPQSPQPTPPPQAAQTPPQKKKTSSGDSAKKSATESTNPCKSCGALLPKEWKACPYCGKLNKD